MSDDHIHGDDYLSLNIIRGKAIQAYADLELSLGGLFGKLAGLQIDVARIIFHRITLSRSRNQVIELLLNKRCADRYDAFWHGNPGSPGYPRTSGAVAIIRQLDDARNKIVHWQSITDFGISKEPILVRPNLWEYLDDDARTHITQSEIADFITKAVFAARSVDMFSWICLEDWSVNFPDMTPEILTTWREIFQRPCTYPTLSIHPLFPNYAE